MIAPKKIVPAGGALWRRKICSEIRSRANAAIVLTALTPTRATPSAWRDRFRTRATGGADQSSAATLRTGAVREHGEVAAPLAHLIALAVVGRHVHARLVVDGRHLRAAPPDLTGVLESGEVVGAEMRQLVVPVAADVGRAEQAVPDVLGGRLRSRQLEGAAHQLEV